MNNVTFREQLHLQIDNLPDDIVQQIADFTFFVLSRREITPLYTDWEGSQWQDFSLDQVFRDDDEIEYTLEDAQEIFHP